MQFIDLPGPQVGRAVKAVREAFTGFSEWDSVNEDDGDHFGFTVWGERLLEGDRVFYVTLEQTAMGWRGHLTMGQHFYMWTSADFGDACLASTETCASLDEAVAALKAEISSLFRGILDGGE